MELFVYIVECKDKSFYTGITNDIDRRVAEHNDGLHPKSYTYSRRPVKLVYCEGFSDPYFAIEREKQIKGWTRAKKIALIQQNWKRLIDLSKSKGKDHPSTGSG